MDLNGKVVIVTGGSSGIGRSLVVKFLERGAVVVIAARSREKLDEFSRQLAARSYKHLTCPTDVTRRDEVERMVDLTVRTFGRVDVLVNCAGAGMYGRISEADPDEVRRIFELNFFGAMYAIQRAYPLMSAAGAGLIVNISSTAGFRAWPNNGYYCATKHALNALSESLMLEGKRDGIDVVLVMPGTTNTSFIANSWNVPEETLNNAPMDMTPDEAAEQILKAIGRKQRRVVLTIKGKVLYLLNRLSPGLVDRLLAGGA